MSDQLPPLPEPMLGPGDRVHVGSHSTGYYSANQMNARWQEGYQAGKADAPVKIIRAAAPYRCPNCGYEEGLP